MKAFTHRPERVASALSLHSSIQPAGTYTLSPSSDNNLFMHLVISNDCHSNNHSGNPTSNVHAPNSNFNCNPDKHKFDASNNADESFSFISNTEMKILLDNLMGMNLLDLKTLYDTIFVKLDKRNGYVVDYSPILTAVLGCHTNALLLG